MQQTLVAEGVEFGKILDRLASEIVEKSTLGVPPLALVGIRTRGVPLAKRLAALIEPKLGARPPIGTLDITLYRDDLIAVASQPIVRSTDIPFAVGNSSIVLVDDVLFTGRTVRAAITALVDFGRPRKIELLVMVDRGWRELPIHADYVGAQVPTAREQTVQVLVEEEDGRDAILLLA
ncbi:MAG TPA: bifunctional pyr operon transcriptional regulator/uracil phosphoribosyltransferase PyrR [Vicinamibacteria bacterium]|nr:bifunctional pyr operon transcriptional regulator/uracil phosphoribosyltransferase PyrR [Vicinamibacteria bacterium]